MGSREAFLKVRILTLLWGFAVTYWWTGSLIGSVTMFSVMVIGNTVIMWAVLRGRVDDRSTGRETRPNVEQ